MVNNLIETNKLSYQYCRDNYEQINAICSPLVSLGIDYFAYIKILEDGRFFNIVNNLSLLEKWLFTSGGFGNIIKTFYEKPEPKSYILTPYDEVALRKDRTISLLNHYHINSSFNIFKRDNFGCLTGYHFYSTSNDPLFSRFYLEHIHILEHFSAYFDIKARNLIDLADKSKFANFYEKVNIPNNFNEKDILNNKINQFLLDTHLPHASLDCKKGKIKLTPRQEQCLYYLSQGQTFKQIGRFLGLSPRTIEFYFSRLKEKSGYKSREELIVQFNKSALSSKNC